MIFNIADKILDRMSPEMMAWVLSQHPTRIWRMAFALHRFRQTVRWAGKSIRRFIARAFAQRGINASEGSTPPPTFVIFSQHPTIIVRDADIVSSAGRPTSSSNRPAPAAKT